MRKSKRLASLAGVTCAMGLVGAAHAAIYGGNGAGGFGGPVGSGAVTVTDSGGNITFSFSPSGGSLSGNDLVLYIDSTAGGFSDTSAFSDNNDPGRTAVSGYNAQNPSRTLAIFASGFQADYAISIEDSFVGLFGLASGGNNSLNFITGNTPSAEPDTVTFPIADLGITPGHSFNFVGTLISGNAYRSNETISPSVTVSSDGSSNAAFNGTTTFSSFDSYTTTPVPEPASLAVICVSGLFFTSRRRSRLV